MASGSDFPKKTNPWNGGIQVSSELNLIESKDLGGMQPNWIVTEDKMDSNHVSPEISPSFLLGAASAVSGESARNAWQLRRDGPGANGPFWHPTGWGPQDSIQLPYFSGFMIDITN